MRYYDQIEAGQFPHQRQLCQAIVGPRCALEDADANPLTVRLLAAREALTGLEDLLGAASSGLPALRLEAAARWGIPREQVTLRAVPWTGPTGAVYWVPAAVRAALDGEDLALPFDPAGSAFPLMQAHALLFRFFTALCAAMERVASELAMMYQLDAHAPTWQTLAAGRPQQRAFRQLRKKDPAQSAWVSGAHAARVGPAFVYRDLMARDGLLPLALAIHPESLRWQLMTLSKPEARADSGVLNADAPHLCRTLLADALTVIDSVYYIMLYKLTTSGQPPW